MKTETYKIFLFISIAYTRRTLAIQREQWQRNFATKKKKGSINRPRLINGNNNHNKRVDVLSPLCNLFYYHNENGCIQWSWTNTERHITMSASIDARIYYISNWSRTRSHIEKRKNKFISKWWTWLRDNNIHSYVVAGPQLKPDTRQFYEPKQTIGIHAFRT